MKFEVVVLVLLLTACNSSSNSHNDHALADHVMHEQFAISAADAPTISIEVLHDDKAGYNVHVDTTKFIWDPASVNKEDVIGTGHAHLYVDGVKIARMYSPDFHIASLPIGAHTIRVELNTNTHKVYAVNSVPVGAQAELTVDHDH